MSFAIGITAAAILGGTLASYLYDDEAHLPWRLCAGATTGLAVFGWIAVGLACLLNLTALSTGLAVAVVLSPLLLLARQPRRAQLRAAVVSEFFSRRRPASRLQRFSPALGWLVVVALTLVVADRVMFERPDGIYTGVANNLGDLPFHVGAVTRFAWGHNFPPEHPSYAGASFTYPFIADFIAAVFVWAGASLRRAFMLENVVLAVSLIGLLYGWAFELTGDRRAARITPVLILGSGGLGWMMLGADISQSSLLHVLREPPHDYTVHGTDWRWGNMVTALLLPQRSLLLGLPLAIVVLTLLWKDITAVSSDSRSISRRRLIAAGILTGILPLIHAHTYAVMMSVAACLALIHRRVLRWTPLFLVAVPLGIAQIAWISLGNPIATESFVGWHVGWDHGNQNILWFWLKNTGATIPLLLVALYWRGPNAPVPRRLLLFFLPFALCFFVPNLVRLAPWIWDNIKVLIYWQVAAAPLIALFLSRVWGAGSLGRLAAVLLTISMTLSGALDIWRVISHSTALRIFTREGMTFAELVRSHVPAGSVIVHAPTYNHPVFLSGRQSFMGYPGHVWSHGISYGPREAAIQQIYAGAAEAAGLIGAYRIDYLVLGPLEREQLKVNQLFVDQFQPVVDTGEYRLFQLRTGPR